jgi:hypothetical protein
MVSPSLLISQKRIPFSSVNSFIRQADSKPLATKCIGKKPDFKPFNELSGSKGKAISYTPVTGEHRHIGGTTLFKSSQ